MAGAEEEEEVLFDQAGLLNLKLKPARSSRWCRKFTKTIFLSLAFFTLGVCIAIPGPTLLDLGQQLHTDTEHMAVIFTARSIGYLVGSIMGGFLFDHFDKQLLLCLTLFLCAVATTAIPWCLKLVVLAVMISIQGVAMGVLDTGGNMFCIRIWGKKSGPYMQTMHFAFGVGAFLAPLLAKPFLSTSPQLLGAMNTTGIIQGNIPAYIPGTAKTDEASLNRTKRFDDLDLDIAGYFLVRDRRDDSSKDSSNITRKINITDVGIETTNISKTTTPLPKPTTIMPKPKKPIHTDPELLTETCADGECIKKHLENNKGKSKTEKEDQPDVRDEDESGNEDNDKTHQISEQVNATVPEKSKGSEINGTKNVVNVSNSSSLSTTLNNTPSSAPTTTSAITTKMTTTTKKITTVSTKAKTAPVTTLKTVSSDVGKSDGDDVDNTVPKHGGDGKTVGDHGNDHEAGDHGDNTVIDNGGDGKTVGNHGDNQEEVSDHGEQKSDASNPDKGKPNDTSVSNAKTDESGEQENKNHKPNNTVGFFENAFNAVKNMSKIQFAYLIIGLFLLLTATLFLVMYCHDKHGSLMHRTEDKDHPPQPESLGYRITLLVFLFIFFFLYVGMEVTYGALILTFAVQHMKWSKDQGAVVTAIYWGSLAAGRGFAIFIAKCCHPPLMLIINLFLAVLGAVILSFGIAQYEVLLWAGTLLFGLGLSSVFPTGVTWAEYYIRLTGKATAVFVVGSALGEMAVPAITGYTYQNLDHMSLMYMMLVLTVLSSVIYIIMQFIASKKGRIQNRAMMTRNGFRPLEDEDDMDMEMAPYGTTHIRERRILKLDDDDDDEQPLVKLGDDD